MANLDEPTFNLKAVVQETGLKADTLRAWERRYGLPAPERTEGGHRLYSQQDIDTLKWLISRQQEGLSISRAVDMWRKLEADGQPPIEESVPSQSTPTTTPAFSEVDTISELRQTWVAACLSFNEQQAEQILAQAFALHSVKLVCFELIQKGLADIGQGWFEGKVTVQQEHFASGLVMRWLEAMLAATPAPTQAGRVVIGCSATEDHTLTALMLALLLRRHNREVVYLGANVPTERIETIKANLIILSAQSLLSAATLLETGQRLKQAHKRMAYGGRIFNLQPEIRERIPGYFLGENLNQALQNAEKLLIKPPALKNIKPASAAYQETLTHFRERRATLESRIWHTMTPSHDLYSYLSDIHTHLAQHIIAALKLGSLKFLNPDLAWLMILWRHTPVQLNDLKDYLRIYYRAAKMTFDEPGQPIVRWLAQVIR